MLTSGRQLQSVYRLITPDNLSNINEMSSIASWLETEERYLTGVESNIIEGAQQFVRENTSNIDNPVNSIALTYRGIFDTMLQAGENVGFINNRPAFYAFKKDLQAQLGKVSFTSDQHKFVDKTLFLDLMTRPESPFVQSNLISKETFNSLYTNPSNNIVTRLATIKAKYPKLASSPFISMLQVDDHKDPFYSPGNDIKHTSVLVRALHASNGKARKGFELEIVDAYKNANESVATSDYENQSSLFEYLKPETIVILDNPDVIFQNLNDHISNNIALKNNTEKYINQFSIDEIKSLIYKFKTINITKF